MGSSSTRSWTHVTWVGRRILLFVYYLFVYQAALVLVATLELSSCAHELGCSMARGVLVPLPGMEPMSFALQGKFLTAGPPGKPLEGGFLSTVPPGKPGQPSLEMSTRLEYTFL